MKRIGLIMLAITIVGGGVYFIVSSLPFLFVSEEEATNSTRCKSEKRALEESISGILVSKFRDKESHMWETIEYSSGIDSQRSVVFMNDQSGAFDFIAPGDSLFKGFNSLELKIVRNKTEIKYLLDYGCRHQINNP